MKSIFFNLHNLLGHRSRGEIAAREFVDEVFNEISISELNNHEKIQLNQAIAKAVAAEIAKEIC